MNTERLQTRLDQIIKSTEALSFPLFSSYEKKRRLLVETRSMLDKRIDKVLTEEGNLVVITVDMRSELWTSADGVARKEFGDLPEKEMLNGFYLQEVMHRYTELQAEQVLTQING